MCIRNALSYGFCLFFLATGFARAAQETVEYSYRIPVSRILTVEAPGALDYELLNGLNAGESDATATLHIELFSTKFTNDRGML